VQMLNAAYSAWQDMSVQWLNKVFGQPEFVDKSTSKMAQILKDMGMAPPISLSGTKFA